MTIFVDNVEVSASISNVQFLKFIWCYSQRA